MDGFQDAYLKYHKGFTGYYDEYVHDGMHNYPFVSAELKEKITNLLNEVDQESTALNHEDPIDSKKDESILVNDKCARRRRVHANRQCQSSRCR